MRVKGIDGLRALAALSVFFFHAKLLGMTGGGLGVDLFFVISGFVITRTLKAEYDATGKIAIGAFYIRRALRLWPVIISVCFIFWWLLGIGVREWLPSVTYVSNITWIMRGYPRSFSHTWSLAVEEQFYLIWPLALLVFLRSRNPIRNMLVIVLIVCLWRVYIYSILDIGPAYYRIYYATDTRLDALLVGAILVFANDRTLRRIGALWPIAVCFIWWALFNYKWNAPYEHAWRMPVVYLSSAVLIAKIASDQSGWITSALEFKPLVGLGTISYAFYAWHYPILYFYTSYGKWGCLAVTILFAWGSWILIERPIKENRGVIFLHLKQSGYASIR